MEISVSITWDGYLGPMAGLKIKAGSVVVIAECVTSLQTSVNRIGWLPLWSEHSARNPAKPRR
jgi:hypothetical protein